MLTFTWFSKTSAKVLSKTTYNLTFSCLVKNVKNISLKKEVVTRVALYTSLSSDPFGSQSFSPKAEENQLSTTTRTQINVDSLKTDPFSVIKDAFSSNT
jgi:hypothetical protein